MNKYLIREWESDPVTTYFKSLIKQAMDHNIEQLSNGSILHDAKTAEKYSYAVGFLDGLRFVLNAELTPEEDDINEITRDTPS